MGRSSVSNSSKKPNVNKVKKTTKSKSKRSSCGPITVKGSRKFPFVKIAKVDKCESSSDEMEMKPKNYKPLAKAIVRDLVEEGAGGTRDTLTDMFAAHLTTRPEYDPVVDFENLGHELNKPREFGKAKDSRVFLRSRNAGMRRSSLSGRRRSDFSCGRPPLPTTPPVLHLSRRSSSRHSGSLASIGKSSRSSVASIKSPASHRGSLQKILSGSAPGVTRSTRSSLSSVKNHNSSDSQRPALQNFFSGYLGRMPSLRSNRSSRSSVHSHSSSDSQGQTLRTLFSGSLTSVPRSNTSSRSSVQSHINSASQRQALQNPFSGLVRSLTRSHRSSVSSVRSNRSSQGSRGSLKRLGTTPPSPLAASRQSIHSARTPSPIPSIREYEHHAQSSIRLELLPRLQEVISSIQEVIEYFAENPGENKMNVQTYTAKHGENWKSYRYVIVSNSINTLLLDVNNTLSKIYELINNLIGSSEEPEYMRYFGKVLFFIETLRNQSLDQIAPVQPACDGANVLPAFQQLVRGVKEMVTTLRSCAGFLFTPLLALLPEIQAPMMPLWYDPNTSVAQKFAELGIHPLTNTPTNIMWKIANKEDTISEKMHGGQP